MDGDAWSVMWVWYCYSSHRVMRAAGRVMCCGVCVVDVGLSEMRV